MNKTKDKISFEAVLFCIYIALMPIHQVLRLGDGSTVNKYLAFIIMAVIFVSQSVKRGKLYLDKYLLMPALYFVTWCFLTCLWSGEIINPLLSVSTIYSHIFMFLVVCTNKWNDREKKWFLNVLLISCLYFSISIIGASKSMTRATFVYDAGTGDMEADQNLIAVSIGMGALVAVNLFATSDRKGFLYIIVFAVMILAVIATGSRGGLGSTVIAVLYMFFCNKNNERFKKKFYFVFLIFILLLFAVFFFNVFGNDIIKDRFVGDQKFDTSGRSEITVEYLEAMNSRPWSYLIGVGYKCSGVLYSQYFNTKYPPATHNELIGFVCETGVIGLILFVSLIVKVWKMNKYVFDDYLGRAFLLLVVIAAFDIDICSRYAFWIGMIFAYIGVGKHNGEING